VKETIKTHCDLEVYRKAFDAAMRGLELSKRLPKGRLQPTNRLPPTLLSLA